MEDVKNVWSVTINGKNDCVVMSDAEVMLVKLKFTGTHDIEMYNMTERHGMKPEHLHKMQRMSDAEYYAGCNVKVLHPVEYTKGVGPGAFGGAARMVWEFEDLMEM